MNLLRMAWRNVWRNQRRSLVTIAAIALALTVELLYSGLVVGYVQGMERDVVDLELGDVQIHAEGYRERPSLYTKIEAPEPLLAALDERGYPASARLLAGGLGASGKLSAGVQLLGLNVERDQKVSSIHARVAAGAWLDPGDPSGVVVGSRLGKTLELEPGDELIVLTQGADGSMANELYTVRGVLLSVAGGTDRAAVFMTEDAFRELMVFPEGAHRVIVRRPAKVPVDQAAEAVQEVTGPLAAELEVKTWKQLMPVVATMLESTQGMIFIIFFIIYIAVGLLLLNAMLMAVFERIREFGLLKALGVEPRRVMLVIFAESAIQTAIAILISAALATPSMWYLATRGIDVGGLAGTDMMGVAMRPVWYGVYNLETIKGPFISLFVIIGLAILYPAFKAARLNPVQAMRHR